MGAPIGITVALGAIGWVQPLGSPRPQMLWGGCAHWGHSGGYGMGAPIGVTVALGAVGWVNPWGSQWGLWGG